MQLESTRMRWGYVRPGGNYTTNGYPTRIPQNVAPSGDGVIPVGHQGSMSKIYLQLLPFGVAATNTFSFQILGWDNVVEGVVGSTFGGSANPQGNSPLWIPTWLGTYQATLGTTSGVAGSDLSTTQVFATTITLTAGPKFGSTPADVQPQGYAGGGAIYTPGSNTIGFLETFTLGFNYIEVIFTTGGVATSCNALWRLR